MNKEELKRIEAMAEQDLACEVWQEDLVAPLVAEVRRLRGLIKAAECQGAEQYAIHANCPWCGYAPGNHKRSHAPECPAFTENGDVR